MSALVQPLSIGYVHIYDGQEYVIISVVPYVRQFDGAQTWVYILATHCADSECAAAFEFKVGLSALQGDKGLTRRCPKHRRVGVRVHPRERKPVILEGGLPVGSRANYKDTDYTVVRHEIGHSRWGGAFGVLVWTGPCATCGEPFEFNSGKTGFVKYPTRNCHLHRKRSGGKAKHRRAAKKAKAS